MDELDAKLRVRGTAGLANGGGSGGGQQHVQRVAIVGSRSENQLVS